MKHSAKPGQADMMPLGSCPDMTTVWSILIVYAVAIFLFLAVASWSPDTLTDIDCGDL